MEAAKVAGGIEAQLRSGRVRIVGWIRPFHDKEIANLVESSASDAQTSLPTAPCRWISVSKPDGESRDHAIVTFEDPRREVTTASGRVENYKLDWCYEQAEDIGLIFLREVKPVLRGVFDGQNASILAYGARDSGKTQLMEGCSGKPGLASLVMHEILEFAERNTRKVMISCYEVCQDHVFDILEPKDQGVQVLETAGGKIQLKGLSQVNVKSFQDFRRLYHSCNRQKHLKKDNVASRRHKGLIISVPCSQEIPNSLLVGRISIIDLAGYEDMKLKKAVPNLTDSSKINRSLYALLNVVSTLNASDGWVPYRENKLTYLLKDFINKESQTLLITCLKPVPCQDTVQVVAMSSRSCLAANNSHAKSIKKRTTQGPKQWRSPSSDQRPRKPPFSREMTFSMSRKQASISRFGTTPDKPLAAKSPARARNLFKTSAPNINSVENYFNTEKESCSPDDKENSTSFPVPESLASEEDHTTDANVSDVSSQVLSSSNEPSHLKDANIESQLNVPDTEVSRMEDIYSSHEFDSGSSPLLSERLREISNSLKLLSCQPLSTPSRGKVSACGKEDETDNMEPKTPICPSRICASGICYSAISGTPKETFKARSVGLKNSLVQECLAFLNRANKEELKELKGIGEKRLGYILELREDDPEPFKELNDLQQIGLTPKQAKTLVRNVVAEFFN